MTSEIYVIETVGVNTLYLGRDNRWTLNLVHAKQFHSALAARSISALCRTPTHISAHMFLNGVCLY